MGRGRISEVENNILLKNPYILDVNDNRIFYADEFKLRFIKEYQSGKKPQQIFREAGLDVTILGSKRIERASARWREVYQVGSKYKYKEAVPYMVVEASVREKSLRDQVKEQSREIAVLKEQIKVLCEACNLQNIL